MLRRSPKCSFGERGVWAPLFRLKGFELMKSPLTLLLVLFFIQIGAGQSQTEILKADPPAFKNFLERNQGRFNENDFNLLCELAENSIFEQRFEAAGDYAAKARMLAEKLRGPLLLAKSYYLLAKSQPPQGINKARADEFYQKAVFLFSDIEQNEETKLVLWQILSDYAILDSSPDYIHSETELTTAVKTLYRIHKLSKNYQAPGYWDLELRSLVYLSNYFAVKGNILTQIVWLEAARKPLEKSPQGRKKLTYTYDVYVRLQKAYRRIGEYEKAFQILDKMAEFLKKYPNDIRELEYLRNVADSYDDLQNHPKVYRTLNEGIKLAEKSNYRIGEFLTAKILKLLQEMKVPEAKQELNSLQSLVSQGAIVEKLDIPTIKAVIAGYEGDAGKSDEFFTEAERILATDLGNEWINTLFLLYWKSKVVLLNRRYDDLIRISHRYLEVAAQNNNKDSLPWVYLNLAKAEFGKGNLTQTHKYNQKAIELIEEKRLSGNAQISVRIMEVLYEAYQLEMTLSREENDHEAGFLTSEKLKSRWLRDKITNNPFVSRNPLNEQLKAELFTVSLAVLENMENTEISNKLSEMETNALFYESQDGARENKTQVQDRSQVLETVLFDEQTAVISYAFSSKEKLEAFVFQKGQKLEVLTIDLSIGEAEQLAAKLQRQIRNGVFFKESGQQVFKILLKPLNLQNLKHLIIIPDKVLWKIPFQALSVNGKSFLIEDIRISYAPSVSILLNQVGLPKAERKTFQVFANARFNNLYLQFADREATSLARAFGIKPDLNSTIEQFTGQANQADLFHFSMHAEVDEEEPFNSFLAFNKSIKNPDGKLTVNNLLKLKLKDQSLVFLASCSTDNVFSSEGLVSLAWGMMAAGATTVISAQWEANDESTEQFTNKFYKYYKQSLSGAESLQRASIEMIHSADPRFNKPYHWAQFTLNGDFR